MRSLGKILVIVFALGAQGVTLAVHPSDSAATVAYDSPYTYEQTFGSALRLVRVDLGCKVTEKDADGGYVLFEYTTQESGNRIHRGSIELVRRASMTHVSVQLPTLPSYHEQLIVDALVKKLVAEHGDRPRLKPAPVVDAGARGDSGAD